MQTKYKLTILFVLMIVGCSSDKYTMSETDIFFANKYNAELAKFGYSFYEKRMNGTLSSEDKFIYIRFENCRNNDKIFHDHKFAYYFGKEISTFISDSFKITTDIPFETEELRVIFIKKRRLLSLHFDKEKTLKYEWIRKK